MRNLPKLKILTMIVFVFILGNLLLLDSVIFFKKPLNKNSIKNDNFTEIITPTVKVEPTVEVIPAKQNTYYEQVRTAQIREVYIPLGSGSTQNTSWTSLDGVEAGIDTGKYSGIKEAYFQVSLRIPTGNGKVSAKLFNVTDKHDVWFSEVENEGATAILKEAKITLTPGSKIYRVYLKSSLNYEAFVDFARIKLIVEE